MRENRTHGSEGGETQINESSLPLSWLDIEIIGDLRDGDTILQVPADGISLLGVTKRTSLLSGHSNPPGVVKPSHRRQNSNSMRGKTIGLPRCIGCL